MKTLFVGPYRQNDGWGEVSRNYIKALRSKKDAQISCRPIYYINNNIQKLDDEILESENTSYDKYDIIIQKTLPHNLYIGSSAKNIGIINVETGGWQYSRAKFLLNKLDEIYVATSAEKKWLESSNIKTPIKIISQPIDVNFITANQKSKITLPSVFDNIFKFYCIVEPNNERYHLDIIVKAFHIAFGQLDRVALVIKTVNTSSPHDSRKLLSEQCENLKKTLHINNHYKNEFIISDNLNNHDMIGLHNSCNCFINISSGNNFCAETIKALYLGNTPIVMNNTGLTDIINEKNGFIIKSEKNPVTLKNKPLHHEYDIFTAYEYWYTPSLNSLIETMKKVYSTFKNDRQLYNEKKILGENILQQYTYEHIGQKLCS